MATIKHRDNPSQYVMIPTALARDPWVSPEAKELYLFASTISNEDDFVTYYIEKVLGMPEDIILAGFKELNDHGYTRFAVTGNDH